MHSKPNSHSTMSEQWPSGCCQASLPDGSKSTETVSRMPDEAEDQGFAVDKNADVQSNGCCSGS